MFGQWMTGRGGWITLTTSSVGLRRVTPPIHNSFTISRIKLTYTGLRRVAYATSEGRHCDLPLYERKTIFCLYYG